MATATILNVGDDLCYRIPVMERAGLIVIRSQCSVLAVRKAFSGEALFSGVAFHTEIDGPVQAVASAARALSAVPLILFQNSANLCDERLFDLVIPAQTPPVVWLKSLQDAIEHARNLHERSQQLRQDSANLRSASRELRSATARSLKSPIDIDAIWRGRSGSGEDR